MGLGHSENLLERDNRYPPRPIWKVLSCLSYLSELFEIVLDVLECGLSAETADEDLFGPGYHLKKRGEVRRHQRKLDLLQLS